MRGMLPNPKLVRSKEEKKTKLINQLLKAPTKFLCKARDFYIKSMVICDGHIGGGAIGCPGVVPRSFGGRSRSSGRFQDEEYAELVRVAFMGRLERRSKRTTISMGPPIKEPRSFSVGVARIDEDEVCEFGEDAIIRTKSYAHPRRKY